jgi:hypothetical protein
MLALISFSALSIFAFALKVYRANREAHAELSESPEQKRAGKIFNIVNAAQWALILLVGNILNNLGHPEWVLASVMFIVGAHFIPLGSVFKNRSHYLTGGVMMLWAVGYPFFLKGGAANPMGCLGPGLMLWASALRGLFAKPPEN